MKVDYLHGGEPWVADPNHWNYEAAKVATEVREISSASCLVPSFSFSAKSFYGGTRHFGAPLEACAVIMRRCSSCGVPGIFVSILAFLR